MLNRAKKHQTLQKIRISAGFLILIGLFLPVSFFRAFFPLGDGEPFNLSIAVAYILIISAAIFVAPQIISWGLENFFEENERNSETTLAWTAIILGILLIAKAVHSLFWFLIWDSTTDPLGMIWLPIPIFAALAASFILFFNHEGQFKTLRLLNLLWIPMIIVIFGFSQKVDFRELTGDRAEQIRQAIESYYKREDHYPEDLSQLFPRDCLIIPQPVIIFGQEWCYDGGPDYYRLGYVYREYWSDPRLIGRVYTSNGELPDLQPLCQAEATVLRQSYPNYPYEYLGEQK